MTQSGQRLDHGFSGIISINQPAQPTEDGAFFARFTAGPGRRGEDAVGHAAERQRLQPDPARPPQRRKEQTFTAKQRRLDVADVLNVVIHARLKRHDATGIRPQNLAGTEVTLVNRAAGVQEVRRLAAVPE